MTALVARRTAVTVSFLAIASAAAWALTIMQAQHQAMGGGAAMAMDVSAPLFLSAWVTMLLAMMLPAVTPMVLAYQRIAAVRGEGSLTLFTFIAGYLVVWTAAGLVPLAANHALSDLRMTLGMDGWSKLIASALLLVGVYQLSPWKSACLRACRSPLGFFMAHDFGEGQTAAAKLGGLHGLICLGCCWALMAVMVVVGGMSMAWMLTLTFVFLAEKSWRHGVALSRAVGAAGLAAAGIVLMTGWIPA